MPPELKVINVRIASEWACRVKGWLSQNDSELGVLVRRKLYPAQLAGPVAHGYGIQGFSEGTDTLLYGEMTADLPLYNTLDSRVKPRI